jgi:hypothetical protein
MRHSFRCRWSSYALVAGLTVLGATALSAAPPDVAPVTLALVGDGEGPCATVDPEQVTVYVGVPPHLVEWTVTDKDPSHLWVIEYDGEKPGGTGDQFGAKFRIPCGSQDSVRSGAATKPGLWPYRVSVFQCKEGASAPEPDAEPICVVDPTVIIKDKPGG